MNKSLQLRRGSTAQHSTFTGLEAELTVDVDKFALILHDGITQGGIEIPRLDYVDDMLSTKANISDTLEGYGILDAYSSAYIDEHFFNKDDINQLTEIYYNIETTDELLSLKANVLDVYNKSDIDILLQGYVTGNELTPAVELVLDTVLSTSGINDQITALQNDKFDKAGGTITDSVIIEGDLTVNANTTFNGTVNGGEVVISKQEESVGTIVSNMIKMSQAEYDGLTYVDPNTFYIIV